MPLMAASEPGHVVLNTEVWERFHGSPSLTWVEWKMHVGDDPRWADPTFDDRAWLNTSPLMLEHDMPVGAWAGLGWLRLHLTVEEPFTQRVFALSLTHNGASEIYFDGVRVGGFGRVGLRPEDERVHNPSGMPVALFMAGRREHVIAVRYSNWAEQKLQARYGWNRDGHNYRGFFAEFRELQPALEDKLRDQRLVLLHGLTTTIVPMFVSLLMLFRFLCDRRQLSSLWFAMCTGCLALAAAHTPLFVFISKQAEELIWQNRALDALTYATVVAGIAALYAEFEPDSAWRTWLCLLLAVIAYWVGGERVLLLFIVALAIEGARLLRRGIRAQRAAARILACGLALAVAANLFVGISVSFFDHVPDVRAAQVVENIAVPLAVALFAVREQL